MITYLKIVSVAWVLVTVIYLVNRFISGDLAVAMLCTGILSFLIAEIYKTLED